MELYGKPKLRICFHGFAENFYVGALNWRGAAIVDCITFRDVVHGIVLDYFCCHEPLEEVLQYLTVVVGCFCGSFLGDYQPFKKEDDRLVIDRCDVAVFHFLRFYPLGKYTEFALVCMVASVGIDSTFKVVEEQVCEVSDGSVSGTFFAVYAGNIFVLEVIGIYIFGIVVERGPSLFKFFGIVFYAVFSGQVSGMGIFGVIKAFIVFKSLHFP